MKTTVLLDHEPVADGGWMVHALLRLKGEAPEDRDRIPLNLSLVLDRSGSMMGEKLHAARKAASGSSASPAHPSMGSPDLEGDADPASRIPSRVLGRNGIFFIPFWR